MSDLTGHRTRSDAAGTEEGVACAGVFSRRPGWRLILKPPTKGVRADAVKVYKQHKTQNPGSHAGWWPGSVTTCFPPLSPQSPHEDLSLPHPVPEDAEGDV